MRYKTIQPSLPHTPWFSSININNLVLALRRRTGHNTLIGFVYLVSKSPTPGLVLYI